MPFYLAQGKGVEGTHKYRHLWRLNNGWRPKYVKVWWLMMMMILLWICRGHCMFKLYLCIRMCTHTVVAESTSYKYTHVYKVFICTKYINIYINIYISIYINTRHACKYLYPQTPHTAVARSTCNFSRI
jgi:hypothetical protein